MSQHSNASRCEDAAPYSVFRETRWPKCRDRFISTAKDFEVPLSSVLQKAAQHYSCIAIDDEIIAGTPRIAGTRIPVYMVLDAIEFYGTLEGALKSYPQLSLDEVRECVRFAGEVLEHPVDYESETSIG